MIFKKIYKQRKVGIISKSTVMFGAVTLQLKQHMKSKAHLIIRQWDELKLTKMDSLWL